MAANLTTQHMTEGGEDAAAERPVMISGEAERKQFQHHLSSSVTGDEDRGGRDMGSFDQY